MAKPEISLVSRLLASTVAQMVVLILLATVFFIGVNGLYLRHMLGRSLWGYSRALAHRMMSEHDEELLAKLARTHEVAILYEFEGRRLAFDRSGEVIHPEQLPEPGHDYMRMTVPLQPGGRMVFVWNYVKRIKGQWIMLLVHLVLLTLVIGLTFLFQKAQLKPLQWLHAGVASVAAGDFKTRVPVARSDEIGRVAQAFNQMTRQVDGMITDRERLLADVSHELRSPMTRIKVALALLPQDEKHLTIASNVREMETLVSVLLERERIGTRSTHPVREQVELRDLIGQVAASFGNREPGLHLAMPAGETRVSADPALLEVLIRNLVDNAIKFSGKECAPVRIALTRIGEACQLEIVDQGLGIPKEARERVFEPFFKLDQARGHGRGYGLGLNLCHRIVETLGGTICLIANQPRGTRVIVNFSK